MQKERTNYPVLRVSFSNVPGPEKTDGEATHPGPWFRRRGPRSEEAQAKRSLRNSTRALLAQTKELLQKVTEDVALWEKQPSAEKTQLCSKSAAPEKVELCRKSTAPEKVDTCGKKRARGEDLGFTEALDGREAQQRNKEESENAEEPQGEGKLESEGPRDKKARLAAEAKNRVPQTRAVKRKLVNEDNQEEDQQASKFVKVCYESNTRYSATQHTYQNAKTKDCSNSKNLSAQNWRSVGTIGVSVLVCLSNVRGGECQGVLRRWFTVLSYSALESGVRDGYSFAAHYRPGNPF